MYTSINSIEAPPLPSERSSRFISSDPDEYRYILFLFCILILFDKHIQITYASALSGKYSDDEWEKTWDEHEQRFYFHNKTTGESKWAEDD